MQAQHTHKRIQNVESKESRDWRNLYAKMKMLFRSWDDLEDFSHTHIALIRRDKVRPHIRAIEKEIADHFEDVVSGAIRDGLGEWIRYHWIDDSNAIDSAYDLLGSWEEHGGDPRRSKSCALLASAKANLESDGISDSALRFYTHPPHHSPTPKLDKLVGAAIQERKG